MKRLIYKIYVALFAKACFKSFNRFVITLGLKGLGVNNYESKALSGEEFFIKWMRKKNRLNIVFDVGANEGDYAHICLENNVNKLYCFEPVSKTYRRLKDRYQNNEKVECNNFGLSDSSTKKTIYDIRDSGTSHASLYQDAIGSQGNLSASEVDLETLDGFCFLNKIEHIDLLKIDTEGHEYSVLKGSNEMIASNSIDVIHFEFGMHYIFVGKFLKDFGKLLENYKLYRLLPNGFLPITFDRPEMEEFFFFQNIIAIRKDINEMSS